MFESQAFFSPSNLIDIQLGAGLNNIQLAFNETMLAFNSKFCLLRSFKFLRYVRKYLCLFEAKLKFCDFIQCHPRPSGTFMQDRSDVGGNGAQICQFASFTKIFSRQLRGTSFLGRLSSRFWPPKLRIARPRPH